MTNTKFITTTLFLFAVLIIAFVCNICFGHVSIFDLESDSSMFNTIVFDIRLPKAITAVVAGSGLALSGLLMQSLFRNPLAGPYVLGISSGSSFFVALATMLLSSAHIFDNYFFGKSLITLFSIGGALIIMLLILFVSHKTRNNISILLIGLMLSQILGAMQGLLEFLSSADNLKTFIIWGMGSLSTTTLDDLKIILPLFLGTITVVFYFIKPLNAILLNEAYAQNLGVNINALRISIIIIASVLVGLITAFCGPIAFVGISVPIASRLFFKTSNHLYQITFCLLLGAIIVLLSDSACQLLSSQIVLPINTITTLIGSPIVLYLLFKSKLNY